MTYINYVVLQSLITAYTRHLAFFEEDLEQKLYMVIMSIFAT